MVSVRKDWIINGVLAAAIVLLLLLTMLQKINKDQMLQMDQQVSHAPATGTPEKQTTLTITAANAIPTSPPILETESQYNLMSIPKPTLMVSAPSEYPNLGKINIFRALITPLPKTPAPTPTPPPTPSIERATENWALNNPRRRAGKPTSWVFKDKKDEKARIEVTVGESFTLHDPEVGDFQASIIDAGRSGVTIRYEDQEKTFNLRGN